LNIKQHPKLFIKSLKFENGLKETEIL